MAGHCPCLRESVVVRSLRRLRDRCFPKKNKGVTSTEEVDQGTVLPGFLESLPVDIQFLVMTYLSPADLCLLGATCRYWRGMVRDPLLWRFFLLREVPFLDSVDHCNMPRLDPLIDENESLDDREEGVRTESKVDYMAEYLRCSFWLRQQWFPSHMSYKVDETCYAMFGPGSELLGLISVLPLTDMPYSLASGIGFCYSYLFDNRHKFNILDLFPNFRADRDRARAEQRNVTNRLFTVEVNAESGVQTCCPTEHMQKVCQAVDGFIYVANPEQDGSESEAAQIQAMLSSAWGSTSRPLLVLSCISREDRELVYSGVYPTTKRVSCVYMAKRLELTKLDNPWMIQDVVVASLSGFLDGISWLLRCSGVKLHYG